jgi:hypothetical protein
LTHVLMSFICFCFFFFCFILLRRVHCGIYKSSYNVSPTLSRIALNSLSSCLCYSISWDYSCLLPYYTVSSLLLKIIFTSYKILCQCFLFLSTCSVFHSHSSCLHRVWKEVLFNLLEKVLVIKPLPTYSIFFEGSPFIFGFLKYDYDMLMCRYFGYLLYLIFSVFLGSLAWCLSLILKNSYFF